MRLIDADELIKDRVSNDFVVIAANYAPTAYDVDKVVERLEGRKSLIKYARIPKSAKVAAIEAYNLAIRDVKSGGIE